METASLAARGDNNLCAAIPSPTLLRRYVTRPTRNINCKYLRANFIMYSAPSAVEEVFVCRRNRLQSAAKRNRRKTRACVCEASIEIGRRETEAEGRKNSNVFIAFYCEGNFPSTPCLLYHYILLLLLFMVMSLTHLNRMLFVWRRNSCETLGCRPLRKEN